MVTVSIPGRAYRCQPSIVRNLGSYLFVAFERDGDQSLKEDRKHKTEMMNVNISEAGFGSIRVLTPMILMMMIDWF